MPRSLSFVLLRHFPVIPVFVAQVCLVTALLVRLAAADESGRGAARLHLLGLITGRCCPRFSGAQTALPWRAIARRLSQSGRMPVAREAAAAPASAREIAPQETEKIMLRCQTCGSRHARWEWCSRCGDPNPFAWFKRLRAIAVMLTLGVAVVLAVLAYQRTHSVDPSAQEFRGDASRRILSLRRAGI